MLESLANLVRNFGLPWSGAAMLTVTLLLAFTALRVTARGALFASYVVVKNARNLGMSPPLVLVWLEDVVWFIRQRLAILLLIGIVATGAWTAVYLARDWFQGEGPIGTLEKRASFRVAHELGVVVPAYGEKPALSAQAEPRSQEDGPTYGQSPTAPTPAPPSFTDNYSPPAQQESFEYDHPPASSPARAVEVSRDALLIDPPDWKRLPSGREVARAFPQRALEDNVSGSALLDCAIEERGEVECQVIEEIPAGYGFGDAALGVSSRLRHETRLEDGSSAVGRHARVRLQWTTSRD